jgi:hypothetical protein
MPTFLVESYAPGSEQAIVHAEHRARRTAELSEDVHYIRTTFLPGDETLLHLFEAPSAEVLERAGRLATLAFDRIVEAVEGADSGSRSAR